METNLFENLNKIIAMAAENESGQRSYMEELEAFEAQYIKAMKVLKHGLQQVQQRSEDLHEAIDEFAQVFQEFTDKLYSPPCTPSGFEDSQDPLKDIKSTKKLRWN